MTQTDHALPESYCADGVSRRMEGDCHRIAGSWALATPHPRRRRSARRPEHQPRPKIARPQPVQRCECRVVTQPSRAASRRPDVWCGPVSANPGVSGSKLNVNRPVPFEAFGLVGLCRALPDLTTNSDPPQGHRPVKSSGAKRNCSTASFVLVPGDRDGPSRRSSRRRTGGRIGC